MAARGHVEKTSLTAREKLKVAYAHLIQGYAQHDLASLFDVNPGRINEAVTAIKGALDWFDKEKSDEAD